MSVSAARIHRIALNISGNHKQRIIVPAHIQTVTLADGKELRTVMRAYYLTPGISLVASLFDMLATRAVSLSYEFYAVITVRGCQTLQDIIRKRRNLIRIVII